MNITYENTNETSENELNLNLLQLHINVIGEYGRFNIKKLAQEGIVFMKRD